LAAGDEQADILEKASQVNMAYKVLIHPDEVIKICIAVKGIIGGGRKIPVNTRFPDGNAGPE